MVRQYNILKVSPGNSFKNAYGEFDSYFLTLEGVEQSVLLNRKAGNPAPSGAVWGELEPKEGPKGLYYKLSLKPAPDDAVSHVETSRSDFKPKPVSSNDKESIYRCNALNNAVAVHNLEQDTEAILQTADTFYHWLKGETQEELPW